MSVTNILSKILRFFFRFPTDQNNIATLSPDTPVLGRVQQAKVITSQEPRDANDLRLSAGEVSYLYL